MRRSSPDTGGARPVTERKWCSTAGAAAMRRPMLVALGLSLSLVCGGAEEEEDELFWVGGRHTRRCSGDECTPLLWAAALSDADSFDSAQQAIAGGADLDAVHGQHDSTALMKASQAGRLDLVRLLLDAGAAVNVRRRDGATALMAAAQSGHTAVVALLLNAGAEPLLRSNDGWWNVGVTAYDVAFREGHEETCGLLRTAEEYAAPPAAPPTSRAAVDTIIGTWQHLSRKAATVVFFLNFVCGRLILNLLGRKLLAPAGLYIPGWATNIFAVLLPPGASLCIWVVTIKVAGHLSDDPGRSAAVPVAVAALVGTPLLWICILRRDGVNAAQRRARVNANAAVDAATGTSTAYRRTGSPRLRPSAPTFAEADFRAASGAFRNNPGAAAAAQGNRQRVHQYGYRRRTPVPAHIQSYRPHDYNPEVASVGESTVPVDSTGRAANIMDEAPDDFNCPITQELMTDPVLLADGHSYERAAISRWLASHSRSPKTNASLEHTRLTPNHALRGAIAQFRERRREAVPK